MDNINDYRNLGRPVAADDAGSRIDRYLGSKFVFLSRTRWQKRLASREVRVNGQIVKETYKLKENDSISYLCPQEIEPEVDKGLRILWNDGDVAGVYKPSNIPMHEGGRYRLNTFSECLKHLLGHDWSSVHRLDRETSGLVLCSRKMELRSAFSEALRSRKVQKCYLALARGVAEEENWIVDQPILTSATELMRKKQIIHPEGLPSLTRFEVVHRGEGHTLLRAYPKTGRTHQIRLHAKWSGLPLVGDCRYDYLEETFVEYMDTGMTDSLADRVEGHRLCLHAERIELEDPRSETPLVIDCPMPDDFKELVDKYTP